MSNHSADEPAARTATGALAAQSRTLLESAARHAAGEFPLADPDPAAAAAEVLDELACIVAAVPRTATRVTGVGEDAVDRLGEQLGAALIAHRNLQHRHSRPTEETN